MRLTTAITAATPMTTPMSVRMLRSLCAQRLEAEMSTASVRLIVPWDRGLGDTGSEAMAVGGDRDHIVSYAPEATGITCPAGLQDLYFQCWERPIAVERKKGAPIRSGRPAKQLSGRLGATGRSDD